MFYPWVGRSKQRFVTNNFLIRHFRPGGGKDYAPKTAVIFYAFDGTIIPPENEIPRKVD
jgi:hypothetical protein